VALLSPDDPVGLLAALVAVWTAFQEYRWWRYCKTCPFYLAAQKRIDAEAPKKNDLTEVV